MRILSFISGKLLLIYVFFRSIVFGLWLLVKEIILSKYIRVALMISWTIWPIILVLIISYLSLNLMDQMRDLINTLIQNLLYSCFVFGSLFLFSLTTWYVTRILFILKDQQIFVEEAEPTDPPSIQKVVEIKRNLLYSLPALPHSRIDVKVLEQFTHLTPVLLGAAPYLTFIVALSKVENTGIHQLTCLILLIIYIAIIRSIRSYVNNIPQNQVSISGAKYNDLLPVHKNTIQAFGWGIIILILLSTVPVTNILISSTVGPIAIIFLALTMWMSIASFFTYLDYRYKAPFTLICLILTTFFNNNNHQIRTLDSNEYNYWGKSQVQNVPDYFKTWLDKLLDEPWVSKRNRNKFIPVYLIATEGGGIRSAYWTAAVLDKLNNMNPHFFRHVYAISSVSGGSVGAAIYTAQYRDNLKNRRFKFSIDNFFKKDFLSPLLTAMLIPDLLQKFSPVGINHLDRARYLEDSWESAYQDPTVQTFDNEPTGTYHTFNSLNAPFSHLWRSNGADSINSYRVPILFLNSTSAETGRKGIITPLAIENDSNFKGIIDIQEVVYRQIPLKTAASISARFPIVTPPATIRNINEPSRDAGNFVDGGYLDNSGTTTLLSILSSLTHDENVVNKLIENKIILRIITINNSPQFDAREYPEALRGSYELKAPLEAFFKSWDNSGDARQYAVREFLRAFRGQSKLKEKIKTNIDMYIDSTPYSFNLDRKTGIIPLGWDLSDLAEKRIRDQANRIPILVRQTQPTLLNGLE